MISEGSGMQALSIAIMKMTPPYPKDAMVAMMNVDTAVKILSLMLGQSRSEPRLRSRSFASGLLSKQNASATAPPRKKLEQAATRAPSVPWDEWQSETLVIAPTRAIDVNCSQVLLHIC